MSEADRLNAILESQAPAVFRCLSPLGRQAAFPKGIPWQSAMAKDTKINATIGQMTDGYGKAMPLSVMMGPAADLDEGMTFLYAPVEGHRSVREAWRAREQRMAGTEMPVALPIATHGLTHGLSVLASLFADPDTTLILPTPFWGNYKLIFTMYANAKLATFDFFSGDGFNLQGLADCLAQIRGKSILVLNLPGNPTGYALSPDEARQLCDVLNGHQHPIVVAVDDAYQGFIYEDDRHPRSEFWDLAETLDPERHALFKVDGATKELLFFSSRLGFLTHPYLGEAEDAILSKLKYLIRGTVGSPPGPSQALVLKALQDPRVEAAVEERMDVMRGRYRALKRALAELKSDRIHPYPFNAAFFMLMRLDGVNSEDVRLRLIAEESVGTISVADPNALRVAFCSVDEASIPELIGRIAKVVG
ncbi:MAG: aminotransferase class I/II-fold pyridoxal phosphate-dependent enzyme [Alphaproteobacteria bacterium]|nr:aminotransferase class I/II-fold pyridoxal phosphate-dependent enzyme [Alphaproteobacteria bacterium]MCB9690567.1 aminotransferase class I/II-fold pyridoxal phosphate-dependent enzyme [Alphaproteobacteria bacterium]